MPQPTSSAAMSGASAAVNRKAQPRAASVAAQPQPDDRIARGAAHRIDHPAGEQGAVRAPFVVTQVRQTAHELTDQAVLSGVDLDTVAAGTDCDARG